MRYFKGKQVKKDIISIAVGYTTVIFLEAIVMYLEF